MADEFEQYGKSIYDLRVTDLKKELDKRSLSKSGNKKELVERLKAHHLKEANVKKEKQLLLEKCRADVSAEDTDDEDGAPNLSRPDGAKENTVVSEYLAKRKQLMQEQNLVHKQWEDEQESKPNTDDEGTSPTKEAANNHSAGRRGIRITREGLSKMKPANNDNDDEPISDETQNTWQSPRKRNVSEGRSLSPEKQDSNEEDTINIQPPIHTGSRSPSPTISRKNESPQKDRSVSPEEKAPSSKEEESVQMHSPVKAKPRSRSATPEKVPSPKPVVPEKAPSPKSTSQSPEVAKDRSRSLSPPETTNVEPVRKPSPAKEKSRSRSTSSEKERVSEEPRSPVRSNSSSSLKRPASAASNKSDKQESNEKESPKKESLKKESRKKESHKMENSATERARGPVRSRRAPSSSSSVSPSDSSSSSGSSRSRSRSRSNSPHKKRPRKVSRSPTRSRSPSPETLKKIPANRMELQKSDVDVDVQEKNMESTTEPTQEPEDKKPEQNGNGGEVKAVERAPFVRRRRWGSTRTTTAKSVVAVSTDSLKGLIPEIKPSALSQEPVLELTPPEEEEEKMEQEEEAEDVFKKDLKIQRTVTQEVTSPPVKAKDETPPVVPAAAAATTPAALPPVVPENDDVRQVEVEEEMPEAKSPVKENKESPKAIQKPRRSMDVAIAPDDPQPSRRSPSPARNPMSCIIHVRNLVRPYTLRQLKEVLGRTGTLVENRFWIDNIKSHAYATYETEEQAKASRQTLHGTRWPSSNPKLLRIEYATQDEVDYHKSGDVTPASIKRQVRQDVTAKPAAPPAEDPLRGGVPPEGRSRKEEPRGSSRPDAVREWDRDKVRQSRSRSRERRESDRRRGEDRSREKSREQEKKKRDRSKERKERKEKREETEEAPAKLLDDLFCKTKATPCIYWLPLTEEQAQQRAQRLKAQEEERERRRKEMLKKDEEMRRQREKERDERLRHRDGPPRRSQDRNRPGDRAADKNRDNRGRRSRSRSRGVRRR